MAAEVSVVTNPLIVYGMVGLLLGAVVLALIFSRPRHGLGAVKRSDVPESLPTDEPWMPTGDIFGGDGQPEAAPPDVATQPPAAPAAPGPPSSGHDPWSTGAGDETGVPPPWGRR
jgi:hypothetical protein